ncbi:MAG: bifunctional 5,10-methylenetetrahydrofolate dehydrogenase/5,10-methenyltetrahydrofolate cyclohydrolase [Planctomycetota bacterium]|jgi:methylenetetrahydrofolate dehydrogenase (NADP+)/methenyltetrahydrofolate cyclohydrolase
MAAKIINGKHLADAIRSDVRRQVDELAGQGIKLKLAAIMVGEPPASMVYARSQARKCEDIGIAYELVKMPADSTEEHLADKIEQLNNHAGITGIMLHLPLPLGIDAPAIQYRIDPYKDVEGVNPANIGMVFYREPILAPCTALAVVEMIRSTEMELYGTEAVVVGQGTAVGLPLSVFLIQNFATVTACHIATQNLIEHTAQADLLVVAVGKAGLITADHVKPGAVVIDVGINRVKTTDSEGKIISKTVGDVDGWAGNRCHAAAKHR